MKFITTLQIEGDSTHPDIILKEFQDYLINTYPGRPRLPKNLILKGTIPGTYAKYLLIGNEDIEILCQVGEPQYFKTQGLGYDCSIYGNLLTWCPECVGTHFPCAGEDTQPHTSNFCPTCGNSLISGFESL